MRRMTRALGMIHAITDKAYLKMAYRLELGARLNLDDAVTLNEKLQWLKLNGAMDRFSHLADKWTVREHVRKVLGDQYLVPTIGVYNGTDEIPWRELPDQFVAKCTHGSHCGVICTDRATFDQRAAERKLRRWLNRSWYWFGREPVYKGITPRIVVERFMGQGGQVPIDYKIMCYHGEPRVVQVHEKVKGRHTIGFYDVNGRRLDILKKGYPPGRQDELDLEPINSMLLAARKLAQSVETPYLRTDFYYVGGQVFFSELTFFDSSGFRPFEPVAANAWLGSMLHLDKMSCPRCGKKMNWKLIAGSKWCDHIERYDQCADCGHERIVKVEASS